MRFFNMFAVALSVLFLGSAQAAPFISSGEMPDSLIEPVRWHGYGYYGDSAHCYAPYVAVGYRCVYGGYRSRYYGNSGGYYGYGGPKIASGRPLGYDAPLCWIPHGVDNSGGSQVWVPAGHWGPLAGQLLHLLWGRCGLMLVLRDAVDGGSQGAVVPLPARLLSGPQRGSFNPRDGQLYIAGSTGWQTSALKDGALQRVRFTGKFVYLPIGWHAHSNGLTVTFTQPLDRAIAEDLGSYAIHQWNYLYAAQYGSKDWSVANPGKEGRDELTVTSAHLAHSARS
jgi:hypothetical protein